MRRSEFALVSLLLSCWTAAAALAEDGATSAGDRTTVLKPALDSLSATGAGEHPLAPALKLAHQMLAESQEIKDYSCRLVLRERIHGELQDHEYLEMKVRHEPFSVYFKKLHPKAGEEAIYVAGLDDGLMWGHTIGQRDRLVGAIQLDPLGARAMQDRRHPITEAGILNLGRRIIESGTRDLKYGECEVEWFEEARINDRPCTCVEVVHPHRRKEFQYHKVRIYVDHEWRLPVRYESYGWPREEDEPPPLLEEYTYVDLRFNNGFTDLDFDPRNPAYKFRIVE